MTNKTNFEEDYKAVIEQHLPSHLSKTLQEKLASLDKVLKENKELTSKVECMTEDKKESTELIKSLELELTEFKVKELELKNKELELFKFEKELQLREIRVLNEITKKEMAMQHTEDFKNVLTSVFTNKQVFETITTSKGGSWVWDNIKSCNVFVEDGNSTTSIIKS